jgi:hypothetical protein
VEVSFSTDTSLGGIMQCSTPIHWTVEIGSSGGGGASLSMILAEKVLEMISLESLADFLACFFFPLVVVV